jgi:hypothetical protein
MSDLELSDYRFLSSFIFNKCGLNFRHTPFNCPNPEMLNCWGGLHTKQYPDELAKLLVFIYKNKLEINSYCEIGFERGGTFCIIDSFLRSINPNMGESLGIDLEINSRRRRSLNKYVEKYSKVKYVIIDSRYFKPSQKYDLCFIDGDHSYNGVKRDFELMKPFCKYIALHDIKFTSNSILQVEVSKFWDELDGNKIEFLNDDSLFPKPVGIGLWQKM